MTRRWRFLAHAVWQELGLLFRRKRAVLVVLFGVPLAYPLILSLLYGQSSAVERPALLVDLDDSALSRRLALDLDASQGLRVVSRPATLEAGWAAIRRGQAELLLLIPADYSRRVKRAEQAQIKLWVNASNMLTYSASYAAVNRVVVHHNQALGLRQLQSLGVGTQHAAARVWPVVQQEHLLFHPTLAYGGFLLPGLMIVVIHQTVLIALTLSVGQGRELGLAPRRRRYPFTRLEARALALLAFYLAASAVIVFVIFPLFGWPMLHPGPAFVLLATLVLTLLPVAMLLAHLTPDRFAPFQVLMFLSVPLFMLSGHAWPLDQMPAALQWIAATLPSTPATQAFRVLSMKSASLSALAPYLAWMLGQLLFYLLLCLAVVRVSARRAHAESIDLKQPLSLQGEYR